MPENIPEQAHFDEWAILEGDHKGEPGVIIRKTGYRCYEVLTLAGHSHVYLVNQVWKPG